MNSFSYSKDHSEVVHNLAPHNVSHRVQRYLYLPPSSLPSTLKLAIAGPRQAGIFCRQQCDLETSVAVPIAEPPKVHLESHNWLVGEEENPADASSTYSSYVLRTSQYLD